MKKMCVRFVVVSLLVMSVCQTFAQAEDVPRAKVLPPYYLPISYSKTTNLLFPYAIKSVDIGSNEVLAQVAKGAENILQIKSAQPNFQLTNLSVITSDGRFFPFTLVYDEDPWALNLSFFDEQGKTDKASFKQVLLNDAELSELARTVDGEGAFMNKSKQHMGIRLSANGIYVHEKTLWFSLSIGNESLIDYFPTSVRFFIQDKKRSKRTAVQSKEITPIFLSKELGTAGGTATKIVMALPVFTVPKGQQLVIRIAEKDGGRNLALVIRPGTILKARLLPEQ